MKVFGVIPARKNSKRLPGKNMLKLGDRPLLEYTLQTASESNNLDRIFLSTDDLDCIALAQNYPRIEIPFIRPAELSDDKSTDLDVFSHLVNYLLREEKCLPEMLVHLRPTSPLRTTAHINEAVDLLKDNKHYSSLRSVTQSEVSLYKLYHIFDSKLISPHGKVGEFKNLPDQLLPTTYRHVGYVDAIWTKTIIEYQSMTGNEILPYVIPDALPGINSRKDFEFYEVKIARNS